MHPPSPMLLHALRRGAQTGCVRSVVRHPRPSGSTRMCLRASSSSSSSASSRSSSSSSGYTTTVSSPSPAARGLDRGPRSAETTQTDFAALNVLGSAVPPSTAIDVCFVDGFQLDNGVDIRGSGCLLVQGEAFTWRPWAETPGLPPPQAMLNPKGQWEVGPDAWGVLECVWPKPELLILGLGASVHPLAPTTKHHLNALGIQVDIQDTRNAAAQFNLLATERGVRAIAAALIPVGWRGRKA